jgi:hypothetical protein
MLKASCPDEVSMRSVLDETPLVMYLGYNQKKYDPYDVDGQLLLLVELLELGIEYYVLEFTGICQSWRRGMKWQVLKSFMYGVSLTNCMNW